MNIKFLRYAARLDGFITIEAEFRRVKEMQREGDGLR